MQSPGDEAISNKMLTTLLKDRNLLILDSAMGTELQRRGADISLPLWSSNAIIYNPELIKQIHLDNIKAGTDIITANTFRTQKRTLQKANFSYKGHDYKESALKMTQTAVNLAKEAVFLSRKKILVAGSIAPLEDCYRPDLVPSEKELLEEHSEHCLNLIQSGIDFLLAETMSSLKEISAVLKVLSSSALGRMEYCISLLCKNENFLFSNEPLDDMINILNNFSPSALLINCIHPSKVEPIIKRLKNLTALPTGVYANIGKTDYSNGDEFIRVISATRYYDYAKYWKELGVKIIGGCCGTTPEYIKKISILKD